jgi:5'-AMP-activated protein kinase catalytic alpha subunit
VLELVTGGELFELLAKEGRFNEVRARFFFQQLVEGVRCCHKKGVAHRDLKVS